MARLPFARSQVTQVFGPRDFPQDPFHKGIDFGSGVSVGLAVPVASAGIVIGSGQSAAINFWKEVDHGGGWTTRYHMLGSSAGPGIGDRVSEGQTIGFIGPKFGVSTGVHLHFEVHNKNQSRPGYGSAVDPLTNINNIPSPGVPSPEEEISMIRIQSPGRGSALIGPGFFRPLRNAEEIEQSTPVILRHVNGNDRQFDIWRALAVGG